MTRRPDHVLDELLVLRAQDGEVEAMTQLVKRWQRPLWAHARRLTGNTDAAWDLVQDFWTGAVRGIARLRDPARFRYWAYRIVTNKSIDWVRRQGRRRKAEADLESRAEQAAGTASADVPRVEQLRAEIAALSPEHQTVLQLKYREGFHVNQIAELLDIPLGTVKSRLHHARRVLRERLDRNDP